MIRAGQLWLAVEPVDMRLGHRWLVAQGPALPRSPCDGSAYVFAIAGSRLKLLTWDGTGVWLCLRRSHQGSFSWPQSNEAVCALSDAEWRWLTSGADRRPDGL